MERILHHLNCGTRLAADVFCNVLPLLPLILILGPCDWTLLGGCAVVQDSFLSPGPPETTNTTQY